MSKADNLLAQIRTTMESYAVSVERYGKGAAHRTYAESLVQLMTALDAHLSAGGRPPEVWREGPDAPELDAATGHEYRELPPLST